MDSVLIVAAIVILLIFIYMQNKNSPQEGMVRYYIPFTRSQFGVNSGAPLFYSPVLMKQTNRCGDYGYNY